MEDNKTLSYDDIDTHKETKSSNFEDKSDELYNTVLERLKADSNYIQFWRATWTKIILASLIFNALILVAMIVLKFYLENFDIAAFASIIVSIFVETIGLIAIMFKFLFNNTDNKNADIYLKLLELTEKHEKSISNKKIAKNKKRLNQASFL